MNCSGAHIYLVTLFALFMISPRHCQASDQKLEPLQSIERESCSPAEKLFPPSKTSINTIDHGSAHCSDALVKAMATNRHMPVDQCWDKAKIGDDFVAGVVLFKRSTSSTLLSVFVGQGKDHFSYQDLCSGGKEYGEACSKSEPDTFRFEQAFTFPKGELGLVYTLEGFEGMNTYAVITKGNQLDVLCHSYESSMGH